MQLASNLDGKVGLSLSCVVRESQTQVVFTSVTLPADCSETV